MQPILSPVSICQDEFEDPLAYLPYSIVAEYPKGATIYGPEDAANCLYLVMDGRVSVSWLSETGRQTVIDIYRADDFFGESAFVKSSNRLEHATTLHATTLMSWTASSLAEVIERRPRLSIALLQVMTRRSMDLKERVKSLSGDTIARRLARALLRLALHMGSAETGGAIRMAPLTHELLAQYIGTSREIVTVYMTQLRRMGCLHYSRKGITVYAEALRRYLGSNRSHE